MILSNIEIQKALDEKRLVIAPEPSPRQPTGNATDDCPYQTSSVDLRLAPEISYFKEGLPLDINLSRGGFAQLFGPMSESFRISQGQPFSRSGRAATASQIDLGATDSGLER
jgi:dCTP deaminase